MRVKDVVLSGLVLMLVNQAAVAGYSFERNVGEVQVLADRVRIYVGTTYGTCGANEGWWGWSTSDPRHKDWLSVVLSAQAQNRIVVVYDAEGSCSGPGGDTVGLESLSIK